MNPNQCVSKCNMAHQKQIRVRTISHKHSSTRQTITNIASTNHMLEPRNCLVKMFGNTCSNSKHSMCLPTRYYAARAQNPMTNPDRAAIYIACDVFRCLRAHAMCSSETIDMPRRIEEIILQARLWKMSKLTQLGGPFCCPKAESGWEPF